MPGIERNYTLCTGLAKSTQSNLWVVSTKLVWNCLIFFSFSNFGFRSLIGWLERWCAWMKPLPGPEKVALKWCVPIVCFTEVMWPWQAYFYVGIRAFPIPPPSMLEANLVFGLHPLTKFVLLWNLDQMPSSWRANSCGVVKKMHACA